MVAAAQRSKAPEVEAIASVQNPVPFCYAMVCSVGSLSAGEALNAAKVVQENRGLAAGLGRKRQATGRRQNKAGRELNFRSVAAHTEETQARNMQAILLKKQEGKVEF
jgi:hypothetical protein